MKSRCAGPSAPGLSASQARALRHQALQQGRIALRRLRLLPVDQRPLQLQPSEQEAALLLEPAHQQGPLAQQGLVRHLDPRPAVAAAAHDEQPRLHEGLQRALRRRFEFVPGRGAAAEDAAVVDARQCADEGLAHRTLHRAVRRPRGCQRIGAAADRVFQRVQAVRRVTERAVVGEPDHRPVDTGVGLRPAPQFTQREGQQRHRVGATGVVHHGVDHARRDGHAGDAGRAFDDLRQARRRQR